MDQMVQIDMIAQVLSGLFLVIWESTLCEPAHGLIGIHLNLSAGDDRYKFGTLVFFNRLGHVGIVVDEEGFYHASSSKGVTYSKFEGYWENRIAGFRRVPLEDYLY